MASLNSQQEKSLTAFVTALGLQDKSLPPGLQKQLHAIGQNLQNRVVELPAIAAGVPSLNRAYQDALANVQAGKGDKSATLVSSTNQDDSSQLFDRAVQIFTDSDPVQAAQRNTPRAFGQVASNPFKRFFRKG